MFTSSEVDFSPSCFQFRLEDGFGSTLGAHGIGAPKFAAAGRPKSAFHECNWRDDATCDMETYLFGRNQET